MEVMARRSTVLKISNLVKKYGDHTVIDHFNLQVYESDAVALTGRNGSGKSTVLRCIVGSDKPTEGTIEVLGEKAKDTEISFRRNVATVIDDLDFFPDLSVVEHLDLLARAHGLEDTDELVDSILEEVQLVPQSGQLPGTLSSGQRRRLALATAFVRPKKLLVLDEPEQRLDQEGIDWLGKRLRHEKEHNGLAIIMASHEPSLVEAVGARIVRIGGGLEESQSLAEPEQLA
ncbi:ABC transporter ATP-binding protein [Propionibacterium freudenreichii]|uniref:ABC transporter ATP-binding protein n=1 Tax=Propionibacterium freudenreichii TaxID=1744 RepID=UPI000A5565B1|nr:ABC transporter ATP-binding protein [Propionibacterium freudenreichii]MDK9658101.1 ABC transporter ATP-binding protein [Propionibacterium freudenreichii]